MAITKLRELNRQKLFTGEQLANLKRFQGKFLDVYPHHYEYWKDGVGFETVYEVRGISTVAKENYESVEDILH